MPRKYAILYENKKLKKKHLENITTKNSLDEFSLSLSLTLITHHLHLDKQSSSNITIIVFPYIPRHEEKISELFKKFSCENQNTYNSHLPTESIYTRSFFPRRSPFPETT